MVLSGEFATETRLSEALGLLDEVNLVLLRVNGQHPDLIELQARVQQFSDTADCLPLGEAVQRGQDLREAVGRFGFNIADPIVAMAWADFVTALDTIFSEVAPCSPSPS